MSDLKTKAEISVNGKSYEFEIYQMDEGVVTGFKFDGRLFLDVETVKNSIDLFTQMAKSNFFDQQEEKVDKEKLKLETVQTVPSNIPKIVPSEVPSKLCRKCGETKPTTEFYKSKKYKDGLLYYCKSCTMEYNSKFFKKKKKHKGEKEEKSTITFVEPKKTVTQPVEYAKAPDNTTLFLKWLVKNNKRDFDIRDFVNDNPDVVTMESAKAIVAYQITRHKLQQQSNTTFRIV